MLYFALTALKCGLMKLGAGKVSLTNIFANSEFNFLYFLPARHRNRFLVLISQRQYQRVDSAAQPVAEPY